MFHIVCFSLRQSVAYIGTAATTPSSFALTRRNEVCWQSTKVVIMITAAADFIETNVICARRINRKPRGARARSGTHTHIEWVWGVLPCVSGKQVHNVASVFSCAMCMSMGRAATCGRSLLNYLIWSIPNQTAKRRSAARVWAFVCVRVCVRVSDRAHGMIFFFSSCSDGMCEILVHWD